MEQLESQVNPETLTVVANTVPSLVSGIGLALMALALVFVTLWALDGARAARRSSAGLCEMLVEQLGEEQARGLEVCQPNAGSGLEGAAALPALLGAVCGLAAAGLLWHALTSKSVYTFDRATNHLSHNATTIVSLGEISTVAVNRHGRSFALDLLHHDGQKTRLSTYLTASGANDEARRVTGYLSTPVRTHNGFFQTEE